MVVDNNIGGLSGHKYRRSGVRSQADITEASVSNRIGRVVFNYFRRINSTLNDCCYARYKSNSECSNYKQSLRTGLGETLCTRAGKVSELYLSTVGLGCGPAKALLTRLRAENPQFIE